MQGIAPRWGRAVSVVVALSVSVVVAATALGDDTPQPVSFTHNISGAPAPVPSAVFGTGPAVKTGMAICSTAPTSAANVNTDCELANRTPHNETSIAVNPVDPNNIIGGANDYQLGLNSGGHVSESVLSRAHVTFDGGRSWSEYPIFTNSAYQGTGDPAVAFDATGRAYYATLGFRFVGPANATGADILVSHSSDGGKTWSSVRVAQGSGVETSVGDFLDKEYIAAWGNGSAVVVYGDFRQAQKGAVVSVRDYASVTHDGGVTWSTPRVITGALDQSYAPVPTIATDAAGHARIIVAFLNSDASYPYRDTYYAVEVSATTGARTAGPFAIGRVYDGATDYPIDAAGRQTYQDSQMRTWAAGNITADPTRPGHLAVVWDDMRNSTLPAPMDPYVATTNSDVIVSTSSDYGHHWSTPTAIARRGDQFMPWGAYTTAGTLRIGTFDRKTDPANHTYDYSLGTYTGAATAFTPITTVRSDPTKNDRWFAATVNPAFPFATLFMGDYSNIAASANGGVVAYWTDMRQQACFGTRCGHGQDAYFAHVN